MTLDQFVDGVRNITNGVGDTFWDDEEIYTYLTNRANQAISVIGLIEGHTQINTVASTQTYSYPTNAQQIRDVQYENERLKRITFDEWDAYRNDDGTYEGRPDRFLVWNQQIYLVPTPDAVGTLDVYFYGEHPFIDNVTQTTIDVPAILHSRLMDGVLADMFAKDLNVQLMQFYERKWENSMSYFARYASRRRQSGQAQIIRDSNTSTTTDIL